MSIFKYVLCYSDLRSYFSASSAYVEICKKKKAPKERVIYISSCTGDAIRGHLVSHRKYYREQIAHFHYPAASLSGARLEQIIG